MKPLNSAERKVHWLKFIGIYLISIVLIVVILSGFLKPASLVKTIRIEKEKPVKVITRIVYVNPKNLIKNNPYKTDSLKGDVESNQKKIAELNEFIDSLKNIISQSQSVKTSMPVTNVFTNNAKLEKLNKQIKFLDWALRSQVAVTNTLTKENNNLKAKVNQLSNK